MEKSKEYVPTRALMLCLYTVLFFGLFEFVLHVFFDQTITGQDFGWMNLVLVLPIIPALIILHRASSN